MDSEFKDYKSELLAELPAFREVSEAFLNGGLSKAEYKGKSGGFGVYAQRDKKSFMIRLRISAGVLSMEQLGFIYRSASEAGTDFVHLTTRGAVQIHNLNLNQVMRIMEEGIGLEIFTRGGGGNFPRNVANSPTGGFMKDDAFDVSEYAVLTDKHFYKDMTSYKLPRKFKVSYSSNAGAEAHSTVQEVGFIAKIIDGERKFDVYIGGGLGNHPRTAFLYEENIEPKEALYYVDAMLELFKEHGNYEDKSRARIRYIVEEMGEDKFKSLYRKYVEAEKKKGGRDFHFDENKTEETAESCPNTVLSKSRSKRIIRQSVRGRYGIKVHPIGGNLKLSTIETLIGLLGNFECPKLRLGMDESLYIMDLNSDEFDILKKATDCSSFETNIDSTISCIGVPICQVGIQTSQSLTAAISAYYNKRKASYKLKNALPVIHISGCQNSCGAHQIGGIGFTGTKKRTDAGVKDAYIMSLMGSYTAGSARLADEVGCFEASDIPAMLYQIGTMVLEEKKDICTLHEEKSKKLDALLAAYRM